MTTTTQLRNSRVHRRLLHSASVLTILSGVLLALSATFSYADSATWSMDPTSGDWNTAANWTPKVVPNGPSDIATFDTSGITEVSVRQLILLESINFSSSASAFTISTPPGGELAVIGSGVENNSGTIQNFEIGGQVGESTIQFSNSATAGTLTTYTVTGSTDNVALIYFLQTSSAGNASFTNEGFGGNGELFYDESSAGNGIFTNNDEGGVGFYYSSTAGQATFTNNPDEHSPGGGEVGFHFDSSAGDSTIINNGSATNSGGYGSAVFEDSTSAENATIINNGSSVDRGVGGLTIFTLDAAAGNSTLIADAGTNGGDGGRIRFMSSATGDTSRVELFGNGSLSILAHDTPGVTIGSLEGDGLVFLGRRNLFIGSNNLSTIFAGVIQDRGSLVKIGGGTLKLSGASTYTGGTVINEGTLTVANRSGSGTGTGAVEVNAGNLGGKGIIAGAVTVGTGSGTGAFLAPGAGARKTNTLTIQSALTIKADGTYSYRVKTKRAEADQVIANGVTIESGAQFSFKQLGNKQLTAGTVFSVLDNTSANPIAGTFDNLPDDSTFTVSNNTYQADYQGGDGNDLTLTVVP